MAVETSPIPPNAAARPLAPGVSLAEVTSFSASLDEREDGENRRHALGAIGLGVVAAGVVALDVVAQRYSGEKLTHSLPFLGQAQEGITKVDDVLAPVGEYGIPATIAFIAAVKALSPFSNRARFADKFSSQEPSSDGGTRRRLGGLNRRVGMAMAGAALATFTAGIATEVGEGPSRPIDAFNAQIPGNTLVVQYKQAMPMVESGIQSDLQAKVRAVAENQGDATHSFSLNLGAYEHNGSSYTDLFAGIEAPIGSLLFWGGGACEDIPALVDTSSKAPVGTHLLVNGVDVRVVGTTEHASSMNRVSGLMDERALKSCLAQDPEKPSFGLSVEADTATTQSIIDEARAESGSRAPAAVVTKEQYKENSEVFWDENVKPITSVLSLAAMGMSMMAMASAMGNRLLRNRRELGARLAARVNINTLRFAEMLRASKDGVVAGVGGAIIGIPLAIAPNAIQQGFEAGAGVREVAVGAAVGLIGSVGGAVLKLAGLKKVANPAETTRI